MPDDIQALFGRLGLRPGLWVNGQWQTAGAEDQVVRNPATAEEISRVALAGPDDFRRAIDGAQGAFERWRREPNATRGKILKEAASLMASRRQDIAELLPREQGKPL